MSYGKANDQIGTLQLAYALGIRKLGIKRRRGGDE